MLLSINNYFIRFFCKMKKLFNRFFSIKNMDYYTEISLLNKHFRHIKAKKLLTDFNKQKETFEKVDFILKNGINKEKIFYEIERFKELGTARLTLGGGWVNLFLPKHHSRKVCMISTTPYFLV